MQPREGAARSAELAATATTSTSSRRRAGRIIEAGAMPAAPEDPDAQDTVIRLIRPLYRMTLPHSRSSPVATTTLALAARS